MIIFLEDKTIKEKPGRLPGGKAVLMAAPHEAEVAVELAGISAAAGYPEAEDHSTRFESRGLYDYLSIHIPDLDFPDRNPEAMECYLSHEMFLVIGEGRVFDKLGRGIEAGSDRTPVQALALLFNLLLAEETGLLESMDDVIDLLEEEALKRKPEDHASEIITLRKQLAAVKHYFDSLYDLLEELEENKNGIFTKSQLSLFRAHKNKVNRLVNRTLNLRERLTQVREAFQNQLDISLNETMRFFTVITAIFLPLTLIVGWYGMNLRMPELESAITYPVIIGVSLAFIVISLLFCKKKGWF